jgi:peroxiredoxin
VSADRAIERLPVPEDDGAADHLPGTPMPQLELPATTGPRVRLDSLIAPVVIFVHPNIGGIDAELLAEWTAVPGARGCTPEACSFRDERRGFRAAGADLMGLSSQPPAAQREAVSELQLPYPLLSDEKLELARRLPLPTFEFHGRTYFRRLTLIVRDAAIQAALYPVFPPDQAARQALGWLTAHSRG